MRPCDACLVVSLCVLMYLLLAQTEMKLPSFVAKP